MPVIQMESGEATEPEESSPAGRRSRAWVATGMVVVILVLLAAQVWHVVYGAAPRGVSPWVVVGTLDEIRRSRVVFVREADAFVVAQPHGAIALSARSPHLGERLEYCDSSGWFESPAHGEKFDSDGTYADGPAPTGMNRVPVRLRNGEIEIRRDVVIEGAPRGLGSLEPPAGRFCIGA